MPVKKQHSIQITSRFLWAMDRIMADRSKGKITAKIFGDVVGIASSNLNRIRQNPRENFVTLEAVGKLCEFYKISPAWLILNIGDPWGGENYGDCFDKLSEIEQRIALLEVNLLQQKQGKG